MKKAISKHIREIAVFILGGFVTSVFFAAIVQQINTDQERLKNITAEHYIPVKEQILKCSDLQNKRNLAFGKAVGATKAAMEMLGIPPQELNYGKFLLGQAFTKTMKEEFALTNSYNVSYKSCTNTLRNGFKMTLTKIGKPAEYDKISDEYTEVIRRLSNEHREITSGQYNIYDFEFALKAVNVLSPDNLGKSDSKVLIPDLEKLTQLLNEEYDLYIKLSKVENNFVADAERVLDEYMDSQWQKKTIYERIWDQVL